eukprot:Clim_evm101s128 gene=Clim_evmTU101s128
MPLSQKSSSGSSIDSLSYSVAYTCIAITRAVEVPAANSAEDPDSEIDDMVRMLGALDVRGGRGRKPLATIDTNMKQTSLLDSIKVRRSSRALHLQDKKKKQTALRQTLETDIDPEGIIEMFIAGEKGRGVRASRDIEKGEFVCEYSGDLIKRSEAFKREDEYGIMPEGCYMYYFSFNGKSWCVDATVEGRIGRLINHSRTGANVRTSCVEHSGIPRLVFHAKRDIRRGEELLYDYGERRKDVLDSLTWLAK